MDRLFIFYFYQNGKHFRLNAHTNMLVFSKARLRAIAYITSIILAIAFILSNALLAGEKGISYGEKTMVSPQWYILNNPSNTTNPTNLEIAAIYEGTPPSSSETECAIQNDGPVCLARLDLENFDGDAEDLIGMTVAQADAADAPVLPQGSDDGLAKHPDN